MKYQISKKNLSAEDRTCNEKMINSESHLSKINKETKISKNDSNFPSKLELSSKKVLKEF